MKHVKIYSILTVMILGLIACEGHSDEMYDNSGLSEKELMHTRAIIDSSLVNLKRDMNAADSITHEEMRKEITRLKEEIESLRKKK